MLPSYDFNINPFFFNSPKLSKFTKTKSIRLLLLCKLYLLLSQPNSKTIWYWPPPPPQISPFSRRVCLCVDPYNNFQTRSLILMKFAIVIKSIQKGDFYRLSVLSVEQLRFYFLVYYNCLYWSFRKKHRKFV